MTQILTAAGVADLKPGQWVIASDGAEWCLVDTYVGWRQRMWMSQGGRLYIALDRPAFPLTLADIDEAAECPHLQGYQECGHCRRCGRIIAQPEPKQWNMLELTGDGAA